MTKQEKTPQRILVFQQNGSGESKIAGITKFARNRYLITRFAIDEALPPVIDDASEYLPGSIEADLVLDFLQHPDLSLDLADLCARQQIPVIASGKKIKKKGVYIPPT